jgi:UDP-2,3-diacylglucosamine hydrolase
MQDIVFISDLHLAPERPEIINLFLRFSDTIAAEADKLYILGDFLEYWLGDDDPVLELQVVFDKLTELSEQHKTKLYFMHGNRDFLIGDKFAKRCHLTFLDEPHIINLQNHHALLMHGDTLCTDDIDYQKFRTMVRNPQWQQEILSKSLEERIAIAKKMRQASSESTAEKEEYIMDVNQQTTDKVFVENHVNLIIHGHTHRPMIHKKIINNVATTRIVLGDWYEKGSYLRINDESKFKVETFQ